MDEAVAAAAAGGQFYSTIRRQLQLCFGNNKSFLKFGELCLNLLFFQFFLFDFTIHRQIQNTNSRDEVTHLYN